MISVAGSEDSAQFAQARSLPVNPIMCSDGPTIPAERM
jgi:hypothetical protein